MPDATWPSFHVGNGGSSWEAWLASIAPRRPPRAPVPRPHDPLASKPDTARAHQFLQARVHALVHAQRCQACMHKCMRACLQKAAGSSGVGLRGQWVMRAGDGGAGRAARCDAAESGCPRRAGNTHRGGWPCSVAHSTHSRGSSPRMGLQTSIDVLESMGRRDGGFGLGRGPAGLAMAQDSVKQVGGLTRGKSAVKQAWLHQRRMPGMSRRGDAQPRCWRMETTSTKAQRHYTSCSNPSCGVSATKPVRQPAIPVLRSFRRAANVLGSCGQPLHARSSPQEPHTSCWTLSRRVQGLRFRRMSA